jgi:hypothetical protein
MVANVHPTLPSTRFSGFSYLVSVSRLEKVKHYIAIKNEPPKMMSFTQDFPEARRTGCRYFGVITCHHDKSWCYTHELSLVATTLNLFAICMQ